MTNMFFRNQNKFKSKLFNERSFYTQFLKDLDKSSSEVIIESPFITSSRMELLHPIFEKLLTRRVNIYIITRDPSEHDDEFMRYQSTDEILKCKEMGININLLKGFHHRKLAIIDRKILWEGSLNILSYSNSREIMRRIDNQDYAVQMYKFLSLGKIIY